MYKKIWLYACQTRMLREQVKRIAELYSFIVCVCVQVHVLAILNIFFSSFFLLAAMAFYFLPIFVLDFESFSDLT